MQLRRTVNPGRSTSKYITALTAEAKEAWDEGKRMSFTGYWIGCRIGTANSTRDCFSRKP